MAENLLSSSEEVAETENQMIKNINKSLFPEAEPFKIMDKLIRQMDQSSKISELVNNYVDNIRKESLSGHSSKN